MTTRQHQTPDTYAHPHRIRYCSRAEGHRLACGIRCDTTTCSSLRLRNVQMIADTQTERTVRAPETTGVDAGCTRSRFLPQGLEMHRSHLILAAAVSGTLLLAACSDTEPVGTTTTSSAPATVPTTAETTPSTEPVTMTRGIVLPEGLSDPSALRAALTSYAGYVVVDTETTAPGAGLVTSYMETHPDGSMLVTYASPQGSSSMLRLADGTEYTDESGNGQWVKESIPSYPTAEQIFGLTFDDVSGQDSLEATADGYIYNAGAGNGMSFQLFVDDNRVLTKAELLSADGTTSSTARFSYPENLEPLAAPTNSVNRAELNLIQAEATLRTAAATVLGSGTALGGYSADMLRAALQGDNMYVEIENSYDPYTVGFANDGTKVELVVSDGLANCIRTTLTGTTTGDIITDQAGAMSDLGFTCGTSVVHSGPGLTN